MFLDINKILNGMSIDIEGVLGEFPLGEWGVSETDSGSDQGKGFSPTLYEEDRNTRDLPHLKHLVGREHHTVFFRTPEALPP